MSKWFTRAPGGAASPTCILRNKPPQVGRFVPHPEKLPNVLHTQTEPFNVQAALRSARVRFQQQQRSTLREESSDSDEEPPRRPQAYVPKSPPKRPTSPIEAQAKAFLAEAVLSGTTVDETNFTDLTKLGVHMAGNARSAIHALEDIALASGTTFSTKLSDQLKIISLGRVLERQRQLAKIRAAQRKASLRRGLGPAARTRAAVALLQNSTPTARASSARKRPKSATPVGAAGEGYVPVADMPPADRKTSVAASEVRRVSIAHSARSERSAAATEDPDAEEEDGGGDQGDPAVKNGTSPTPTVGVLGEAEYFRLRAAFENADTRELNALSLSQMQDLAVHLQLKFDLLMFKRLDRDRSGTVDFIEMVRCFHPKLPVAEVKRCLTRWGAPHTDKQAQTGILPWREKVGPKAAEELEAVFNVLRNDPTSSRGLTLDEFRGAVADAALTPEQLVELFTLHDTDQDGELSLDEFAAIMEDSYTEHHRDATAVKLWFQDT